MRVFALGLLLASLAASGAWSQETVSTAATSDAHPPETQASTTTVQQTPAGAQAMDAASGVTGPCGPAGDTRPHGEVGAGVGTGGYRQVEGSVCKNLPNGGAFAIGISQEQLDRGRR